MLLSYNLSLKLLRGIMDPAPTSPTTGGNNWLQVNTQQAERSRLRSNSSLSQQSAPVPFLNQFEEVNRLGTEFSRLTLDGLSTHRDEKNGIKGRSASLDSNLKKREKISGQKKSSSLPRVIEQRSRGSRDKIHRRNARASSLESIDEGTPRLHRRHTRDQTLLESIERLDMEMWRGLCISNESIIDTHKLFSLIHSRFQELPNGDKSDTLINFCKIWLKQNKNTELIKKAEDIFREIKVFAEDDENPTPMVVQKEENKQKFSEILQGLFKNRIKGIYDKVVGEVATDLLRWQIGLYSRLTEHHLIEKKWDKEKNPLSSYIKETQMLYEYVVDAIIGEPDIKNRARLLKFFLRVAQESLKMGNYPVASNFYYAFGNGAVGKLKKTLEKCSSPKYTRILEDLSTVFAVTKNCANLRSRLIVWQTDAKPHIPLPTIYLKDITNFSEMDSVIPTNRSKQYNIKKLQMIKESTVEYIAPQQNLKGYGGDPNFKTDFVEVLKGHSPVDDDTRHERVGKLEM